MPEIESILLLKVTPPSSSSQDKITGCALGWMVPSTGEKRRREDT
jgi:hypothetical protein